MTGLLVAWAPLRAERRGRSVGWIEDGSGCHIWIGARNKDGYGVVKVAGRQLYAHRARYEREVGPIGDGVHLDHVCNRGPEGCCNPHHCRPASPRENTLRGDTPASRNAAKTHCPNGHELAGGNLIPSQLADGHRTCRLCRNARVRAKYHSDLRRVGH